MSGEESGNHMGPTLSRLAARLRVTAAHPPEVPMECGQKTEGIWAGAAAWWVVSVSH